jgi:hypothetical protein
MEEMQIVQAGERQLVLMEFDADMLRQGALETGFDCEVEDQSRGITLILDAPGREGPLLLFDAADPSNTGWFSRCTYYVDGVTGLVLQTPFLLANRRRPNGSIDPRSIALQVRKELPVTFRFPARQPVNEKSVYAVLFGFLKALQETGVGVCGAKVIQPLAGRVDAPAPPIR